MPGIDSDRVDAKPDRGNPTTGQSGNFPGWLIRRAALAVSLQQIVALDTGALTSSGSKSRRATPNAN